MMPDTFMFTVGDLYDGSEMRLVNSGGPAVTFTVSDLPQGLHLNGSSGSIYGSPTEEAAVGNYSVIGHNSGGLGTASFSIGVLATSAPTAVPTSTPTPPPTPTPTSSSGHTYPYSVHTVVHLGGVTTTQFTASVQTLFIQAIVESCTSCNIATTDLTINSFHDADQRRESGLEVDFDIRATDAGSASTIAAGISAALQMKSTSGFLSTLNRCISYFVCVSFIVVLTEL